MRTGMEKGDRLDGGRRRHRPLGTTTQAVDLRTDVVTAQGG